MLSKLVNTIKEYTAGEQPGEGFVKLNTNESPYPPSPRVGAAIKAAGTDRLRLYPDPECTALRQTLAKLHGVSPDCIFAGNGSDEILAFCFAAFFDKGADPVLFPDVTYSFYPVFAGLFSIPYKTIPVKGDLSVAAAAFRGGQGVILANPNAPTSLETAPADIEKLLKKYSNKPVVIDEAYADFCGCSVVNLVNKYPNLCVVRTFSKSYSLAGMRVGYAVASKELIGGLKKIKNCFNSYTVGYLAQAAAKAAAEDTGYHNACIAKIKSTRERITGVLRGAGFSVAESSANFLFISKEGVGDMRDTYLALKERKVLVRYFPSPKINKYLRVTIGSDGDMDAFADALSSLR